MKNKSLLYLCLLLITNTAASQQLPKESDNIFKHGKLKVDPSCHYLIFEDGTPFFYMGDTNWEFLMNARRGDAEILMDNRREKGFTVMQMVVTGALITGERDYDFYSKKKNVYGDAPFIDFDFTKPAVTPGSNPDNPEEYDFWDHVDFIVELAESKNIFIGMLLSWHNIYKDSVINTSNARTYGRWIAERYKDNPNIIWILGGDTRGTTGQGIAMFDELAAGIREGDRGNHLITFHPIGHTHSSTWFHEKDWLDFNMIQTGHSARDIPNYKYVSRDYSREPVKPVVDGESRYEDHSVNWNPENGWFRPFDIRQAAYWAVFAGAFGHTYGTRGVWQMYEPGRTKRGPLNYYWYDAMDLPGGADMSFLKNLILSRPYLSRIPDQSLVTGTYEGEDHIRATRGDGYAFIYIPTGKEFEVDLSKIADSGTINAWWYNPHDGHCYESNGSLRSNEPFKTFQVQEDVKQKFDPPGPQVRGNDWVLVLDAASKGFNVPGTVNLTGIR